MVSYTRVSTARSRELFQRGQKKAGRAVIKSDKFDCKAENITRLKKRSIHNDTIEDRPILNVHVPNKTASKYIKQKWIQL